jgi:hypothetical protein
MRSKLRSFGRCAVAVTTLGIVTASARAADTVQDFSANFNTGSTPSRLSLDRYGEGAVPEVRLPPVLDGWDGGYVRMTHAVNGQFNVMTFNQGYTGDYDALEISFDFSINNSPQGADGFGIVYMNSDFYGVDTSTPTPGITEEANLANSFGVGFDTYNNPFFNDTPSPEGSTPNSMSLHFNNVTLSSVSLENEIIPLLETTDGLPRSRRSTTTSWPASNRTTVVSASAPAPAD